MMNDSKRFLNSKQDIEAVQRTFEMIVPIADTFAFMFYDRFFAEEPEARPLFQSDMSTQRIKVMDMLALAVRSMEEPEAMIQELRGLGLRHVTYRVEPEHYITMNEAIVWALAESLGDQFTSSMRRAWEKTLARLAEVMLAAADSAPIG
jgi:hemoglobin-like flavoprotein